MKAKSKQSGDIVWGCKAIAATINRTPGQTFHMLVKRQIPASKVGAIWVASRRRLLAHLAGEVGK
ncbi:hypothetical protein [Mesorhizobium sp. L2C066B000]|uniref:hypothetical protein n=1 Tax=Mesorhizobium sp. L2C066B000 TaxID=1287105 RepID=UPI0003D04819|nr:hypothetical protein [Mesorhizobium sp. L2C066B000]ESZ35054.1 hypothetical protein X732_25600 [Mesorhizobium sp. L2C066B000]